MKSLWAPWRMQFIEENMKTPSNDCVFCTLPAENNDEKNLIVGRSEHAFIILNRYPYNCGHLMVIPYKHTSNMADLDEATLLDMHKCVRDTVEILKKAMNPHGHNIGMNLGEAGGAGIRDHLHYHIVPRWNGDTNFMPVMDDTKVLPESLEDTYNRLAPLFAKR